MVNRQLAGGVIIRTIHDMIRNAHAANEPTDVSNVWGKCENFKNPKKLKKGVDFQRRSEKSSTRGSAALHCKPKEDAYF